MTKEQLSDAMNMLDDVILEETNTVRGGKRKKWKEEWWKWGAAAAVLTLAVYGGFKMFPQALPGENMQQPDDLDSGKLWEDAGNPGGKSEYITGNGGVQSDGPDGGALDPESLPLLAVSDGSDGEMGFEGYMAYDISELVNANPWKESMEISTLPVYENPLSYDDNYIVTGMDFAEMRELLIEIAGRMGMEEDSLEIADDVPDEETQKKIMEKYEAVGDRVPEGYFAPTKLLTRMEGMKIAVEASMTAVISFEPALTLPGEYHFTHYASYDETLKTARYLEKEYEALIGMENPVINVYGGGYDIYLRQSYHIEFYEPGENEKDSILNYNFNPVAFYCNDEGKLFLARIFKRDLSRKLGDYPVITAEEAKELLEKNNYITNVPYEMPGMDYVKKVELIYRTGEREKYFMPYYRFYVELPEAEREGGVKTYGAYYVPAVEGRYLIDMPSLPEGEEGF